LWMVQHNKSQGKKLSITRNGPPPERDPPAYGAYRVRISRRRHGPFFSPRVDHTAHLSGPERQRCSWGACRESDGLTAAQPPCARTRTEKVPWRRCSGVQFVAPKCPRRPPASGQVTRPEPPAELAQQRKTGSYTTLPAVTSWPPCPRRHSVEALQDNIRLVPKPGEALHEHRIPDPPQLGQFPQGPIGA